MNIKNIKSLAQIMDDSGLTVLEVSENDTKIRLEKTVPRVSAAKNFSPRNDTPVKNIDETALSKECAIDFNNIVEIKSPMVGVFYSAPAPEAQSYVKIGSRVKKGDVLCIIEAMKLMNEITAEVDGEIVDICVQSGQVVEFSQVLFKIF